jgi:hypothetical protein
MLNRLAEHCFLRQPLLAKQLNIHRRSESIPHEQTTVLIKEQQVTFSPEECRFLGHAQLVSQADYRNGYLQPSVRYAQLYDVDFFGHSGCLVNSKTGNTIIESAYNLSRFQYSPIYCTPRLLRRSSKRGTYTSIMHLPWARANYYHWFIDCLPRLYFLQEKKEEPITLIMHECATSFQRETIDLFLKKMPNITLITIRADERWRLERFLLCTFASRNCSGYLPPALIGFVQDLLLRGYNISPKIQRTKRIFVSRRNARHRQILNESKLYDFLRDRGFSIVHLEDMTCREQVSMFANAEVVVGAHGAGLTNLLFAKDATLVEIQPRDQVRTHYFLLAKAAGHRYIPFFGDHGDGSSHFAVDIPALCHTIDSVIS